MENDNNKNIFTFDPGEPPEEAAFDDIFPEGTDEFLPENAPDFDPDDDGEYYEYETDSPEDDEEEGPSFFERLKARLSSVKFKKPEINQEYNGDARTTMSASLQAG